LVYAHERAWLVIVALMGLGAWIRHFFNLRHQGNTVWWIPATAVAGVIALAVAIEPDDRAAASEDGARVGVAEVTAIVEQRCTPCHSSEPTQDGFTAAPAGVRFDTSEQIVAQADAIRRQAVDSRAMPLGNVTGMTDDERELLGAWIEQGAPAQ
jgi:uncharacterized membrane protein